MEAKIPEFKIRDLREYSKSTTVRLFLGFVILLIVVGLGLIYLFYGKGAIFTGLLCVLGGLAPIGLIFLFLIIINKIVEKNRKED